jgi:nitrogen fixation protein FixH
MAIRPEISAPKPRRPRELTGRMVLIYLLAFFGAVFAVNAVLVHEATSTFGGVETESSYKAGLAFMAEENAAHAQDARGWRVTGHIARAAGGLVSLAIAVADPSGAPPAHLVAAARLVHPTDARFDRALTLAEVSPGHYAGTTEARDGQWDLVLELAQGEERMFRSKSRVVLH